MCVLVQSFEAFYFTTKTAEIQLSLNHGHVGSSPLSVMYNEQDENANFS